ncbi:MAG: diguanylate cyclase [Oscillospiraceae bacterium]
MKFKTILMIAAMLFAIIPMVVFAVFSNNALSASGEKEFTNIVKSVAENQASPLNAVVNTAKSDIEFLASVDSVKGAAVSGSSNADADALLKNFADGNALVVGARIVNNSGKIIAGTDSGKDLENASGYSSYKDEAVYFDDASGKTNTNSTMIIKKNFGQCFILISYDIFGDNSLISRICSNAKFYEQGNIMVVDSKGNWSTGSGYNNSSVLNGDISAQLSGLPEGTVSGTFKYTGTDGAENLAAAVKVGGEGGLSAVVSCPTNRAVQFSRNASTTIIVVTIVLSIISAIAAIVVSGLLTAPLKNIQKTLETIRNGDHEARIKNMNNNEYGQLSRAFNNLVDDIVVSEDRYRNISEMSDNIIFEWNFKTNEVVFSNNFNKKFSYRAPSNHFGDSFLLKAKVHPDDLERYRSDLDQLEKGKNFERNEYRIKNIYGDFIWVLMRTATLKDNEGKPVKVVGVMVDIDRGKKSEQQLTERASYDALTELYNRETIENQIDNEISLSEMRKSEMAVLFIDVDDFKHYNDNYSHATGDQVLKFLAKTIKTEVEGIGFGGRYGGDEFIVLLRDAETNDPALFAQRIIAKLNEGFDADIGERLTVSVSIGIALIKDNYNTRVEYLIGKADDAMYSVKKSGKSNYAFIN